MKKIEIDGGYEINGEIKISGAKNAALPIMIATLLTNETLTLKNVPNLSDISLLAELLEQFGTEVKRDKENNTFELTTAEIKSCTAPYDIVSKMRASFFAIGAMVARNGEAKISLPGGCAIGAGGRPLDIHLDALEALGAKLDLVDGYVHATAPNGLIGAEVHFKLPSVGATENIMMGATLAKGTSILHNAATDPEVVDLGNCLIAMGANIEGLGTDTITIHGKEILNGAEYSVMPDRIEAGTYAVAAAMAGGTITLTNANIDDIECLIEPLKQAGVDITGEGSTITVKRVTDHLNAVDVMTDFHPAFATDLQAQVMAMICISEGAGMVTEKIWTNRFMHVPELCRMGANITVQDSSALVRGVEKLKGATVMATDLRASASLVLAGLVAEGTTTVRRIYHLERGYDDIVGKLSAVGAKIRLLDDDDV